MHLTAMSPNRHAPAAGTPAAHMREGKSVARLRSPVTVAVSDPISDSHCGSTRSGRQVRVVTGTVAFHHRAYSGLKLVGSMVLGGIASVPINHLLFSDPTEASGPSEAWGLTGGAGVAAALIALPPLLALGVHLSQRRAERRHLEEDGRGTSRYQLERLLVHARASAPLNLAGLQACLERIDRIRANADGTLSHRAIAAGIAQLASLPCKSAAFPCQTSDPGPSVSLLAHALLDMHRKRQIPARAFYGALLAVARALPVPAGGPGCAGALAAARALQKVVIQGAQWRQVDMIPVLGHFTRQMNEAPYFAPHVDAIWRATRQDCAKHHGMAWPTASNSPTAAAPAREDGSVRIPIRGTTLQDRKYGL